MGLNRSITLTNTNMKNATYAIMFIFLPISVYGQSFPTNSDFYAPDFRVRRAGADSGLFSAQVTTGLETGNGTSGAVSWNLGAGGFVQARASIPLALTVDAQLASFAEITGDSLVFGREITTDAQVLGILDAGSLLQNTLNQVLGASVIYDWQAQASVTGLTIAPDQLYRVGFSVTPGAGLPVGLLENATFGITTAGIEGSSGESALTLDVLELLALESGRSTGDFSFLFRSTEAVDINQLDFTFNAGSTVGVNALGGTAGNQNFLTYSGFNVTQVPELSSGALAGFGLSILLMRRKR